MTSRRRTRACAEQGFTLIELLIVMIIIGLLAAIAVPAFLSQQRKAYETSAKLDVRAVVKEILAQYVDATGPMAVSSTNGAWTLRAGATTVAFGQLSTNNDISAASFVNSADDYCVSVRNADIGAQFWAASGTGLASGDCYSWGILPATLKRRDDAADACHMPQPAPHDAERLAGRRDSRRQADAGFTLIELIVVMSVVGVLATVAVFGFSNEIRKREHRGSAQQLISTLRAASVQSVSEGRTYCVALSAAAAPTVNRSYALWRSSCGGPGSTQIGAAKRTQSRNVRLSGTSTLRAGSPCQAATLCIYFYPRGTASPAGLSVTSTKRAQTIPISVQGLTARVF